MHNFYALYTEIALVNFQSVCVCVCALLATDIWIFKIQVFLGCFFFCRGGELFINLVLKHHQNLLRLSKQTNKKSKDENNKQRKTKKYTKFFLSYFFLSVHISFWKRQSQRFWHVLSSLLKNSAEIWKGKNFFSSTVHFLYFIDCFLRILFPN